jgi:hypothetical protein
VACETIENEIKDLFLSLNLNYPIIWLEGGLHNSPERLRLRLQTILDEVNGTCKTLLLSLGYCGGGVSGLVTGNYDTVIPMADDCLSLLLGSMEKRVEVSNPITYFLTEGWMKHENNIVSDYERTKKKYGKDKADYLNRLLLKNYQRFGLICTGCFNEEQVTSKIEQLACCLGLSVDNLPGDLSWLKSLLVGPHDDPTRFLKIDPKSEISFDSWIELFLPSEINPTGLNSQI